MNKILYLILFINFSISYSQEFEFAVINDKDGFVNVRSSNKIEENNIVDKLENGFVVSHFGAEGNWILVDYEKNGKDLNGYIYKSRIKNISNFTEIPKENTSTNEITFSNKNFEIKIIEKQFDKTKHSFKYYNENPNQLNEIDGKEIFGTDGNIPKMEYKNITISFKNNIIELPKESIENLYEPNFEYTKCNYNEKEKALYIQSMNSDGAGGYVVIWIIKNGEYINRITSVPF
jgi:hypothetical protein